MNQFISLVPHPNYYCILHQKCVMASIENYESYTAILAHYNHYRKLEKGNYYHPIQRSKIHTKIKCP